MRMTPEQVLTMLRDMRIDPASDLGEFLMRHNTRSDEEIAAIRAEAPPPKRAVPPGKTLNDMVQGCIPFDEGEDVEAFMRAVEAIS